jgi:putative ABC transport system permease protein
MINIPSTIKVSLNALRANKMRSALTVLGIIIGVAAVITMLAVGSGASKKITDQISSMGSNVIIVTPGSRTQSGVRTGAGGSSALTVFDADAIRKKCTAVSKVAPVLNGSAQVVYQNQNWLTSVVGTTPEMLEIKEWKLASGRNITSQDVRSSTKVCVLGKSVADNLFLNEEPVGKVIRIKKVLFKVVGVLEAKGQSMMGQDQDDTLFIPITTAQKKIFGTTIPGMIRNITMQAKSVDSMQAAEDQVTELLRQKHNIGPKGQDDFTVRNLTQILKEAQSATRVMTILLGAIASISLLVGGIGIMNIMLVSVTERTREIGIRMAVGARSWDIRLQFIIEAITLSMLGGAIGILLGSLGSYIISKFADWPAVVTPMSVLISFGFSFFVGIFFGYYPAYKASLLHPIDALRYE